MRIIDFKAQYKVNSANIFNVLKSIGCFIKLDTMHIEINLFTRNVVYRNSKLHGYVFYT